MAVDSEHDLQEPVELIVEPQVEWSTWDWIQPWRWWAPPPALSSKLSGLTIVCISDTHGQHRKLDMPAGDILIHAGDYTLFGDRDNAVDFNSWLGSLPYRHIFVVQGNHETNAEWKKEAESMLSNARLLKNEAAEVDGVRLYGTEFFWSCKGANPYYDLIPEDIDILIAHNPPQGYGDLNHGCASLKQRIEQIRPRLVVNGHVHGGRHAQYGTGRLSNTVFVNAATAGARHQLTKNPIIIKF